MGSDGALLFLLEFIKIDAHRKCGLEFYALREIMLLLRRYCSFTCLITLVVRNKNISAKTAGVSVRFGFRPDLLPYRLTNRMNCLVSRVTPALCYIPTVHYVCVCENSECTAHKCASYSARVCEFRSSHSSTPNCIDFEWVWTPIWNAGNAVTKPFCDCAITGAPSGKLRLYLRRARRAPNWVFHAWNMVIIISDCARRTAVSPFIALTRFSRDKSEQQALLLII